MSSANNRLKYPIPGSLGKCRKAKKLKYTVVSGAPKLPIAVISDAKTENN